ncbi:SDR family NAD(P)-dependent oxidoreductase [Sulfurimonas sp.]|uniref:SDR family NAD(P)-dependent oxidoreductase n=1 Tax=Sulfurimonas sp. TaxID=2022749 RepID=UPI002B47AC09|nr:SDR family NAD(P)-dependent oxidoreductase [Sulfurimonas sp.]
MSIVVLITSVISNMGEITAKSLADNGYIVYAGTRDIDAVPDDSSLKSIYIDITKTDSITKAVDAIVKKEGKIDVLVNNACYGLLTTAKDETDEEIFNQFDVNVLGLSKVTHAVLPYMREAKMREAKSGVIINISSFLGRIGLPFLAHYNASKHAVIEGIVDSLRFETLPCNVRVHSIQAWLFGANFVKNGLLVNAQTTSEDSPYKDLISHFVPIINEGSSPQPIADAVKNIIENENSKIFVPVGIEATTVVSLRKELSDEKFEEKVKETFDI